MKVDVQCPFCGECYIRQVNPDKSSILCYVCKKALFLKYATDTKDGVVETDDGTLNVNVFWDEGHALFMFESKQYNEKEALAELLEDDSYPFEIIGNIYENKELLDA